MRNIHYRVYWQANKRIDASAWQKTCNAGSRSMADFIATTPLATPSKWGSRLFLSKEYRFQSAADAKEQTCGKDFLIAAAQILEDDQLLEWLGTDGEYDRYSCAEEHFAQGNLSGLFSGVKFRGKWEDVLSAYDDIMEHFSTLYLHMTSVSCMKEKGAILAEIQLEYDDFFTDATPFQALVTQYPQLRMMAISAPESKWTNWFFFVSGSHSTIIKREEIQHSHNADPDYYWSKSHFFTDGEWHWDDFIFMERQKSTDVYPNTFNWAETLVYPATYWGKQPLCYRAEQTKYAKKIVLPDTARYVTSYAFRQCTNLKEIVMPNVTTIHRKAFYRCKSLKKLVCSEQLVSIDDHAFAECGDITAIAPIGSYAHTYFARKNLNRTDFVIKNHVLLEYKGNKADVVIPPNVHIIGESAFCDNKKVRSITLSDAVEAVQMQAFQGCTQLETVITSANLQAIANDAFANCSKLATITIPSSVTKIGAGAFYGCRSLSTIAIPEGVCSIEPHTFESCKNLREVHLPCGLQTIGAYSFLDCRGLATIDIPTSVTYIGECAFTGCTSLSRVTLNTEDVDVTICGNAFSNCRKLMDKKKRLIVAGILFECSGNTQHVIIPDGVVALGEEVFPGWDYPQRVTIPPSVIAIGPHSIPSCVTWVVTEDSYAHTMARKLHIPYEITDAPIESLPASPAAPDTSASETVENAPTLSGKVFVVTGSLYHFDNREVVKELVQSRGGKLSGSVSAQTTALITNFPDSNTVKLKKARELGVEIISEEEFIRRFLS